MNFSFSDARHTLSNGTIEMSYTEHNVLQAIKVGSVMINLYEPTEFELALSNIYLRRKDGDMITYQPLMYFGEGMRTYRSEGSVKWVTENENFIATVTAMVDRASNILFYTANVENIGSQSVTFDLVMGQDLALADEGAVKSNECYVSQYLDHQIFNDDTYGYVVCSRQNLPQSTGNPWVQVGALSPVVAFSTDGYQFFGKSYRFTNQPKALTQPLLDNERFQFEMGYVALQTADQTLQSGERSETVFYVQFEANMPTSNVQQARDIAAIAQVYSVPVMAEEQEMSLPSFSLKADETLCGEALNAEEIARFFGKNHRFEEWHEGELLSFFYGKGHYDSRYVTLQGKERLLERSTGHMISSGNNQDFRNPILSSTHGMYGVFNSHVVLGNTSFNKLIGVDRTSLNLFKFSGQRIWVRDGEEYRILTMPSAYETGANFSRWIYKYKEGFILINVFSAQNTPSIQLEIELVDLAEPVELSITNQLVMGNNEKDSKIEVTRDGKYIHISAHNDLVDQFCPDLSYSMLPSPELSEVSLIKSGEDIRYMVFKGCVRDYAYITLNGCLDKQAQISPKEMDFAIETKLYQKGMDKLLKHFKVNFEHDQYNAEKLNDTVQWFTHNALVHYSTPHGLEQYSGAAWGTRDVSQGPFELFMSLRHYDKAAELLRTIYSHQHIETGTWPQWFMFDQYSKIQQEDCHGDIVVWPLKALADYIVTTGDLSILDDEVPYTSIEAGFAFTSEPVSLFTHVQRQLKHIVDNLVPGTSLSCYGDGDWDDTLQPANQSLRENMVSGWTIPLTLQALKTMATGLADHTTYQAFSDELKTLAAAMEVDYHHYLVKDGVLAGFIHFPEKVLEDVEYLLHPADQKTGIGLRLLPASRSIISETFNKEMADAHMSLIREKLVFPDGVRLMEKMAEYNAGKQSYFKRAELAANLGREVGLQYCHAHIRFIEALCKMGKADEVYENLYKIVPVGIEKAVPNADLRQSNAYFSSSDGKFKDRYEAYDKFDLLKTGEVKTKGGWRIYSSGPGIYLNQVITSVLGIRYQNDDLVLDPVIAQSLGKTSVEFDLYDASCVINFYPEQGCHTPKRIAVNGQTVDFKVLDNPYRTGAALVDKSIINNALASGVNEIDVWL